MKNSFAWKTSAMMRRNCIVRCGLVAACLVGLAYFRVFLGIPLHKLTEIPNVLAKQNVAKKPVVFILTSGRSGSTLLGEFFNANDKVVYWDEPFRIDASTHRTLENKISLLNAIMQRSFPGELHNFVGKYVNVSRSRLSRSKHLLKIAKGRDGTYVDERAKILHILDDLGKTSTSFYTVVKILHRRLGRNPGEEDYPARIFGQLAWNNRDAAIKVVHLVRDPRAVLASMLESHWLNVNSPIDVAVNARELCKRDSLLRTQLKELRELHPGMLDYRLVKYEDFIAQPEKTLEDLYRFAGLHLASNVVQFLNDKRSSTQFSDYVYSLKRNWTASINKWRSVLAKENIRSITESCTDNLDAFGYKI